MGHGLKHPNNVIPKFCRILTKPERRRNINDACFPYQRDSQSGGLKERAGVRFWVSQFLTPFLQSVQKFDRQKPQFSLQLLLQSQQWRFLKIKLLRLWNTASATLLKCL